MGAAAPAPAPLGTIQCTSRSTMNKGQNLSLHEAEMVQMARICPKKMSSALLPSLLPVRACRTAPLCASSSAKPPKKGARQENSLSPSRQSTLTP